MVILILLLLIFFLSAIFSVTDERVQIRKYSFVVFNSRNLIGGLLVKKNAKNAAKMKDLDRKPIVIDFGCLIDCGHIDASLYYCFKWISAANLSENKKKLLKSNKSNQK